MNHELAHQAAFPSPFIRGSPIEPSIETLSRVHTLISGARGMFQSLFQRATQAAPHILNTEGHLIITGLVKHGPFNT